jgi:protein-S-isoprenylcysteine O-methyltransferase Ste14
MALALGIIVWAVVILASLLVHHKALTSVGNIDRLVTEGVYSRVRHPMYAAFIWLSWGAFLRWPTVRVAVMVFWTDMVLFLWSLLEERLLQARFGEEYSLYKKRVGMLIPQFGGVRN